MGVPSPRELYARLTSSEITEWLAYYSLDPWDGARKHDLPAALVCATIANANRSSKSQSFSPEDFMPKYGEVATGKDHDMELMAQMKSFSVRQKKREEERG